MEFAVPWLLAAGSAALLSATVDHIRAHLVSPDASWLSVRSVAVLTCGHLLAQAMTLGLGGFAWAIGGVAARLVRRRWIGGLVVPTVVLTGALARPLMLAGESLASGAWISEQSFAPLVRIGPLVAGLVALPVLAAIVAYGDRSNGWKRRALLGVIFGAAAVSIVADHRVFPGLYPEFHIVAYAATAIALLLGVRRALDRAAGWSTRRWARGLAAVVAMGLLASPVAWFGASSRTRAEIVLYSPIARDFIRTTMPERKSTPLRAALEELDVSAGTLDRGTEVLPRGLITGAEGMNVMFVVVDTLRADALPPVRPAEGTKFSRPGDTPFLDEWLEHTYRFSHAYTGAPTTRMAMPALFRSIEVSDDLVNHGIPAGQRFEALGLTPVAVVLDWFISGKWPAAAALLDGFEDVLVYEQSENDRVVDHARQLLTQVRGRRFFAWVHFFEVHDPGFDGKLLTSADGSRVERYRRSLRYLDQDFRRLIDSLDEFGLRDNTIIVFVGDHGEGLGEHGLQLHGPNLFDEDLRVPLAIHIPGREGIVVEQLVGLKDVVPTVIDLLGAPVDPNDRGRSLLPVMAGYQDDTPHAYYFQNDDDKKFGLIVGTDKLFWERRTDLIFRSDLVEDPNERSYLYDPEGEIDRALMRQLIEFNPSLVKAELEDEETYALLVERLQEVDPKAPGAALPFVLRLASLRPSTETVEAALGIFEQADDARVRLLVLRTIAATRPKPFESLVSRWLDEVADSPAELEVVSAMARQGQGAIASKTVVARMEHWVERGTPADWEPYLLLVRTWSKTPKAFGGVFTTMLARAVAEPSTPGRITELLLDNVASMKVGKGEPPADLVELGTLCRGLLTHPEPRVRTAALGAVAGIADKTATPLVEAKLHDANENPRVRCEAAAALVKLQGKAAIEQLERVADDPILTAVVLRQFKQLADPSVIPFLLELKKQHSSGWIRLEIGRVVKELEKKKPGKGKGKGKGKAKPRAKPDPAPAPGTE